MAEIEREFDELNSLIAEIAVYAGKEAEITRKNNEYNSKLRRNSISFGGTGAPLPPLNTNKGQASYSLGRAASFKAFVQTDSGEFVPVVSPRSRRHLVLNPNDIEDILARTSNTSKVY